MKILFAGKFDPTYNRTKIIIDGLNTIPEVRLSYYNFSKKSRFNLFKLRNACNNADIIFLPSFSHTSLPYVRLVTTKPIVFDPLISRYLSKVFDYKTVNKHSPRAYKNFLKDKIAMQFADCVLCDTNAHKQYYHSEIGIPLNKMEVLPVGVNTSDFNLGTNDEETKKSKLFNVGFYGSFVPLQGTKIIVEAARLLAAHEDISFTLIGSGFEFIQVKELALKHYQLTSINFIGWVNYEELSSAINDFDIALGIFGESLKADLVIPNKIFHYAAMQKAIITKRTPAIEEIFKDKINIFLSANKPEELAEAIIDLKENESLRKTIAYNAYELITKEYNHEQTGKRLFLIFKQLLKVS